MGTPISELGEMPDRMKPGDRMSKRDVLQLIADGKTLKEAAEAMDCSHSSTQFRWIVESLKRDGLIGYDAGESTVRKLSVTAKGRRRLDRS